VLDDSITIVPLTDPPPVSVSVIALEPQGSASVPTSSSAPEEMFALFQVGAPVETRYVPDLMQTLSEDPGLPGLPG